jgi:hypothetical protein
MSIYIQLLNQVSRNEDEINTLYTKILSKYYHIMI